MDISNVTFYLHISMFLLVKQVNYPTDTFLQFQNCLGVVCKTVRVKPIDSKVTEVLPVLTLHNKPNYRNLVKTHT